MESLRKWFYKPKRDDSSLLAQFFYADEDLNMVTAELDSFDGRKDPERCTFLVNHLRHCQDKVLNICSSIMNELIPGERAPRDFRVKFPDDVMQENLAGQLWFGAECLAAGSSIMNRESESAAMRPLAKALIKALDNVRVLLRSHCFRTSASLEKNPLFTDKLLEALKYFDRLFAEFELRYVSAMVPVKSLREYHLQQMVVVLFSETLQRALRLGLLSQDLVDDYDPALMFTIPRLAIVSGLLIYRSGPICLDRTPSEVYMSEMFRPFRTLLLKIRTLLMTLSNKQLLRLEKMLCSCEEPGIEWNVDDEEQQQRSSDVDVSDSASETLEVEESPQQAVTPPPTPQGFLIQNQVNRSSHGSNGEEAPVITAHSLPEVDHAVSMNIVTEALSSLLTDGNELVSPDSSIDDQVQEPPTTSAAPTEEEYHAYDESWQKVRDDAAVSLDLPCCFVNSEESPNNYRIRTSTRSSLQTFEKHPRNAAKRKRVRKFVKTRSSSAVRVSVTLQIPSHSKRLSRGSSLSSSCSSSICSTTSGSYSHSDDYDDYHADLPRNKNDIQAQEARAPFSSSGDLIHRLFVCIAGVADQLQTNFAGDLRNILKCVFQMNASQSEPEEPRSSSPTSSGGSSRVESAEEAWETSPVDHVDASPDSESVSEETTPDHPPAWVPDVMAPHCMTCGAVFTLVRRRHHCRNCGKVFCSRCSSNSVPLPHFGHIKPVRVCNRCFLCQVTPFMLDSPPSSDIVT